MALYKWTTKLAWIWVSNWIVTSATAPISPVEWMVWYDTTNDVLKSYDGTNWNVAGKEYEQGNWINISNNTISVDTSVVATKTYVDEHDTVVSATAPSSPTEWMVWYDTTNDQLKVYDWTNWDVTGKEYNAGEWISIWSVQSYAAMQWPCSAWYHIPSKNEWYNVKTIWEALWWWSNDWNNFWIALKLPYAGMRDFSDGDFNYQGSQWYYWAAERSDTEYSYCLSISSSTIAPSNGSYNANANSIRPFKDVPVVPPIAPSDPWWTSLYWTHIVDWQVVWILWNADKWIISMRAHAGDDWITIADKNLWATTVWNSWDTLSEANCGKYYQWGNNYWFDWAWTLSDFSPLQVDASAYWPGNYYSSSTYVFFNRNWDSSINYNLWWWTTWVIITDDVISNTGVLSVNWQTGNVTIESWWLQVAPNSPITWIKYVWYGTESDYANLSQYYTDLPWDTEFHTF